MNINKIEVGKTYEMKGALDRRVLDIIWHPAGGKFVQEYREATVEIIGGKNGPKIAKEALGWVAANAIREIVDHVGCAT